MMKWKNWVITILFCIAVHTILLLCIPVWIGEFAEWLGEWLVKMFEKAEDWVEK
jgi:hypothetical protein